MTTYYETRIKPSKNRAEHTERTKKCFDFEPLKVGQRLTFVTPAFDFRYGEDSNYGQHTAELTFVKRDKHKAVHVTFYTGWAVTGVNENSFICTGLGTHYKYKKDCPNIDYASHHTDCPYTGGKCWFELGSGLYGDTILDRLVNEGSYGVWDEIEQELSRDPKEED